MDQFTDPFPQIAQRVSQRSIFPRDVKSRLLAVNAVDNSVINLDDLGTAENTADQIVKRDSSGNFAATRITANLTGQATLNEFPLTFSSPLARVGNTIGTVYTPANKAGDTFTGNVFVQGEFQLDTVGGGFHLPEGTNATMGTAVLVAGTKTVSNTKVTLSSRIFLTTQVPGGTPGAVYISARTLATSFTITSTNGADTSTVGWLLIEPS